MRRFVDELEHGLCGTGVSPVSSARVGVSPAKSSQKYADFKAVWDEVRLGSTDLWSGFAGPLQNCVLSRAGQRPTLPEISAETVN